MHAWLGQQIVLDQHVSLWNDLMNIYNIYYICICMCMFIICIQKSFYTKDKLLVCIITIGQMKYPIQFNTIQYPHHTHRHRCTIYICICKIYTYIHLDKNVMNICFILDKKHMWKCTLIWYKCNMKNSRTQQQVMQNQFRFKQFIVTLSLVA